MEEARQAMQESRIAYAGKYSAPDYERILAAGCTLAIENTMVLHDPEVKEQLEKFGVPVLVERSSYESGPLARMEWLKLYGILLNKTEMAEESSARRWSRWPLSSSRRTPARPWPSSPSPPTTSSPSAAPATMWPGWWKWPAASTSSTTSRGRRRPSPPSNCRWRRSTPGPGTPTSSSTTAPSRRRGDP